MRPGCYNPLMRHSKQLFLVVILLAAGVAGCRRVAPTSLENGARDSALLSDGAPSATATLAAQPATAPVTATTTAPASPNPPIPTGASGPPVWPTPASQASRYGQAALAHGEQEAADQLALLDPPIRDDLALALAYRGATVAAEEQTALSPPAIGERQLFNVLNYHTVATSPIEAELLAVSDYAYFWFDRAATEDWPDAARLAEIAAGFDRVFLDVAAAFGYPPALESAGEPTLHVLNAGPQALCESEAGCGVGGYFSAADALPPAVNPYSNQRRMFVVNSRLAGADSYLSTLAHELRHLVEYEYDRREADWETEGTAMLAEELAGWPLGAQAGGNAFLSDPDLQLNDWSDSQTYRHYGQGYMLSRYIYDRLGADLFREFAGHPASGLEAIDALAEEHGLAMNGDSLWLDWLVALAVRDRADVPEQFTLGSVGLDRATMTELPLGPANFDATVHQYAADYYRLAGSGPLTITFEGGSLVPLLDEAPLSGSHFWYGGRSNYSESRLTRVVDLHDVEQATLQYAVYHDIESQYDFAYISVSLDGGVTWEGLTADGMQRKGPAHDPSGLSPTERFYNGRSEGWMLEEIDLSAYAGRQILLRFSYLTDSVVTRRGFALDNIAIPEIGFYDDAETPADGWLVEGFVRAAGYLPQEWHLQLVTFVEGRPVVTTLIPAEDGRLEYSLGVNGEAILIVAASAPATLEPAVYRLTFDAP